MKNFLVMLLSLFLSLTFLLIVGCKKGDETAEAPKPPIPVKASEVKGTDEHLQKAHEFFLKKDFKAAAPEIQKVVELMKQEAERATKEGKKTLTASANELEQLAKDVEKGDVTSEKKMKNAFARAEHALAEYHYLKASEQWAKKETKETGRALKNAAQHLEQAAKWAGHEQETGIVDVINSTRSIAGKLIEGTGWVSEEVGEGLKNLGAEISEAGKKIEPNKK
jgi:hypothetical protein